MSSRLSQWEDGVGREKLGGVCGAVTNPSCHAKKMLSDHQDLLLAVILEETVHSYQGLLELIIGGTIGTADESCASSAK